MRQPTTVSVSAYNKHGYHKLLQKIINHLWLRRVILWISASWLFVFFYYDTNLRTYTLLKRDGRTLKGKVEKITPEFHNTFTYSFQAANKRYSGLGNLSDKSADLKTGDDVFVVFLPQNPSISTDDNLEAKIQNEWNTIFIGILILPTILVFGVEVGLNGKILGREKITSEQSH